jgi:alkylated DNA nucleotide flippase Atl1
MVKAVETSLRELLEGTKQYQVPLYQRTYSWNKTQFERLWDDLVKLVDDRIERGAEATHFIGSLVLAPTPGLGPAGLQEYLIVDGQQRLTTLTLLLAAIRDHRAITEDPSHRERVDEKYLLNKWEQGQPTKLLPTQADRESYLACIGNTAQAGDADPIGAAYRFFRARLVEIDDPDDDLDIQRLEEAVISGLSLVCVTAQPGDNAHRIFESLNNTGLKLTQGDLLRNYIFMRLPVRGERVYHAHWLPLQKLLSADELEMLFWLDLVQSDARAKQSNTYVLQQARMDRLDSEEEIEAEVQRFARLGSLLQLILDPTRETNPLVQDRLARLKLWGTTTVYPVLLHLLGRRADGTAADDDIVEALIHLESFFVRRVISGKATKNINRILLGATPELRDRSPIAEALRDYLSTGRKDFASDAEIRSSVRAIPFYWTGKSQQRKLILQWIEETYRSKEPVAADSLTIEHVLPQTMTDEWRDALSAELEEDEDLEAVFQGLVHTIGNLTLTGYNSELSNSSFEKKRSALGESGIRMNQEIASQTTWGRPQIQNRADQLAERIIENWPGPNASATESGVASTWKLLGEVLAEIPAGSWTTYGDVAAVIGTHPVPLGQRLAKHPAPNAHRVLSTDGTISAGFRWLDESQTDSAHDVLAREGVNFDEHGKASVVQRLDAKDLASLAGLDVGDSEPGQTDVTVDGERARRFFDQLRRYQPAEVVDATTEVLEAWVHLGGVLQFGSSDETSCFVLPEPRMRNPWPLTVYPSGKAEVVFKHMTSRPPFDDAELRHSFRRRLNAATGVDLPASKIELRPGFSLAVLTDDDSRAQVIAALAWFLAQVTGDDSATPIADQVFASRSTETNEVPAPQLTDRSYWESGYGSPSSLALLDEMMRIVRGEVSSALPKYNKYYVGISQDGAATNFVTFRPRKDHVVVEFKLDAADNVDAALQQSGLEVLGPDYWSEYRFLVRSGDVAEHRALLTDLVQRSHQQYSG